MLAHISQQTPVSASACDSRLLSSMADQPSGDPPFTEEQLEWLRSSFASSSRTGQETDGPPPPPADPESDEQEGSHSSGKHTIAFSVANRF